MFKCLIQLTYVIIKCTIPLILCACGHRQVVHQHERWIYLGLLAESFVKETYLLFILFLQFTLDALILYEL